MSDSEYPIDCENCGEPIKSAGEDMVNPDDPTHDHICAPCSYALAAQAETAGNHNIAAQEEVVSALYAFARHLGHKHDEAFPVVGNALKRIVKAYGFNVASIQ